MTEAFGQLGRARRLSRVLPSCLRDRLRRLAVDWIPSMRHLDMSKGLQRLALSGYAPRVIFDVGAGWGEWARLAALVWPESHIYAFEPNASRQAELAECRRTLPHFSYELCFLGASRGRVTYEDRGTQTSLLETLGRGSDNARMEVIDGLLEDGQVPTPDFIKLDVQGYELEVLRGAERALGHASAILVEVSLLPLHPKGPKADEVSQFLQAHGFIWNDVLGILRRPDDDALLQMDLLFVKEDHSR